MDNLLIFLLLLFFLVWACISINFINPIFLWGKDFKHYRRVYKTLPYRTFYTKRTDGKVEYVFSDLWRKENKLDFVWMVDYDDFRLDNKVYLLDLMTSWNPYAGYWLRKYRRWFKENVDVNSLREAKF